MKKKTVRTKAAARKTVKRTAPKPTAEQSLIFRRIVIISACLVLVAGIGAIFNKGAASQAVAGISIMQGLFDQATVSLPQVPNAVSYNIYYGQSGVPGFSNAVRNISPTVTTYIISYLKKGVDYDFRIAAVDKTGKEFFFTTVNPLTNLQPM